MLLSLTGGLIGILLAFWSLHLINAFGPKCIPQIDGIGFDRAALLFTVLLSLLSGAAFGLVPALRVSSLDLSGTLKTANRGTAAAPAQLVLRSSADSAALFSSVKQKIYTLDSTLAQYNVLTMSQRIEGSLAQRRVAMRLLGLFALVALTLAVIGTYGVMAYLVTQGTREIGIRIALGATRLSIMRFVVVKALVLAISGVAIGAGGAFAGSRFMQSLLFGVSPSDPLTFSVIPLLLIFVAVLAGYIPAHRAAQIDPIVLLREE